MRWEMSYPFYELMINVCDISLGAEMDFSWIARKSKKVEQTARHRCNERRRIKATKAKENMDT